MPNDLVKLGVSRRRSQVALIEARRSSAMFTSSCRSRKSSNPRGRCWSEAQTASLNGFLSFYDRIARRELDSGKRSSPRSRSSRAR
jgi:hypothetical protein